MTALTTDELSKMGSAEEIQIAPQRRNGTLRDRVTVWAVRHGDSIYIRSAVKGVTRCGIGALGKRTAAPA